MSDGRTAGEGGASIDFAVVLSPNAEYFAGHFPGEPVLPGMCHVEFAVSAICRASPLPLELVAIVRARFRRKVSPGEELRLCLRRDPESGANQDGVETWTATNSVAGERAASLTLRFGRRDAALPRA